MGKPLITQRRGKGSPTFQANHTRFKADAVYRSIPQGKTMKAQVVDLIDDPARTVVLAKLLYEDGKEAYVPSAEGLSVGKIIHHGEEAKPEIGNILPLGKIPEGFPVFNVEVKPGKGGNLARASGAVCLIMSKSEKEVVLRLPSKKVKSFDPRCFATIGNASGGGRTKKPLLKAGNNYKRKKAKGQRYPTVRGVKMAAYEHPFGGKEHHGAKTKKGKGGSPGQHVGSFGARRTGRRKRA